MHNVANLRPVHYFRAGLEAQEKDQTQTKDQASGSQGQDDHHGWVQVQPGPGLHGVDQDGIQTDTVLTQPLTQSSGDGVSQFQAFLYIKG